MDELLCICLGEWPEFGNVFEVVECGLAEVIDVGVLVQLLVHFYTQVGDRYGRGDVSARESVAGNVGGAELMWWADEDGFCL